MAASQCYRNAGVLPPSDKFEPVVYFQNRSNEAKLQHNLDKMRHSHKLKFIVRDARFSRICYFTANSSFLNFHRHTLRQKSDVLTQRVCQKINILAFLTEMRYAPLELRIMKNS